MLRRRHKKSREGCLECKRRHVKCDERRPTCLLCTMSHRDCSFASETKDKDPPATLGSSSSSSPSPVQVQTQALEIINLDHMQLLIHLISDSDILSLGDARESYHAGILLALRTGLQSPYLLYQLLAFSACHLQYLHPERSAHYLHQAMTLQTQAISLFNVEKVHVDRSNCASICLFSVVLGHHLFADTMSQREPEGLNAFLKRYTLCLETHRGILTVTMAAWPLLMETELAPVLLRSRSFTSQEGRGNDCNQIKNLVGGSAHLDDGEKKACTQAIRNLQVGFDALSTAGEENMRYQMLFLWNVLVPPEFTDLLAAKRPEGLIILAYYALLLHQGRHIWQVGGAGRYVLGMIEEDLDPGWDRWLQYPRERCGCGGS
ncbi:hypothetical protein BDW59DRAFT_138239 [Aspergillus cavernicola]|uniref:Zn(2)-C6 fungal-type domain-containing protein n=1 Tax=Aspergillus cavernicola TaxID=176166 RepID=A0ABR4J1H7_9EURO